VRLWGRFGQQGVSRRCSPSRPASASTTSTRLRAHAQREATLTLSLSHTQSPLRTWSYRSTSPTTIALGATHASGEAVGMRGPSGIMDRARQNGSSEIWMGAEVAELSLRHAAEVDRAAPAGVGVEAAVGAPPRFARASRATAARRMFFFSVVRMQSNSRAQATVGR